MVTLQSSAWSLPKTSCSLSATDIPAAVLFPAGPGRDCGTKRGFTWCEDHPTMMQANDQTLISEAQAY